MIDFKLRANSTELGSLTERADRHARGTSHGTSTRAHASASNCCAEQNELLAFHHSAVCESIVLGSCARSIHDLNNKGSGNENYFRLTELFIRAIA